MSPQEAAYLGAPLRGVVVRRNGVIVVNVQLDARGCVTVARVENGDEEAEYDLQITTTATP